MKWIFGFILVIIAGMAIFLLVKSKFHPNNDLIPETIKLESSAFGNNTFIPAKYTCDGENINPPLSIPNIPSNTESLVLIMDDPDAPTGTFVHWLVYDIPPQTSIIEENSVPQTAQQGLNGSKNAKYTGPCPPSGTHHYYFKLYALDTIINFESAPDKKTLETSMQGHILNQTQLIGLYKRK